MTQLILDVGGYDLVLPESIKGGYLAERRPLFVDVEMVTGRMVRELRGTVWVVSYQFGFFGEEMKNNLISACEKGKRQPITCGFLPPESSGTLQYSDFFVTDFKRPKFMWSRQQTNDATGVTAPVPMWADFSVSLREVKPSD